MSCNSSTIQGDPDAFIAQRKAQLTPLEYRVTQEKVTERPFSNRYNRHWERGSYNCVICNMELFKSESKFESKSGWPAFDNVVDDGRVRLKPDLSHVGANLLLLITRPDLARTEVSCSNCNAHLGHLFKDGPKPTGLRYCINSSSLAFVPSELPDSDLSTPSQQQSQPLIPSNNNKKLCGNSPPGLPAAAAVDKKPVRVVPAQVACGDGIQPPGKICFFSKSSKTPVVGGNVSRTISAFQNNGHVSEIVSRRPSNGVLRETSL